MSKTPAGLRNLRERVLRVLARKIDNLPVAATAQWIAKEAGSTTRRVQVALDDLRMERLVKPRTHRPSGKTLWKLLK